MFENYKALIHIVFAFLKKLLSSYICDSSLFILFFEKYKLFFANHEEHAFCTLVDVDIREGIPSKVR